MSGSLDLKEPPCLDLECTECGYAAHVLCLACSTTLSTPFCCFHFTALHAGCKEMENHTFRCLQREDEERTNVVDMITTGWMEGASKSQKQIRAKKKEKLNKSKKKDTKKRKKEKRTSKKNEKKSKKKKNKKKKARKESDTPMSKQNTKTQVANGAKLPKKGGNAGEKNVLLGDQGNFEQGDDWVFEPSFSVHSRPVEDAEVKREADSSDEDDTSAGTGGAKQFSIVKSQVPCPYFAKLGYCSLKSCKKVHSKKQNFDGGHDWAVKS